MERIDIKLMEQVAKLLNLKVEKPNEGDNWFIYLVGDNVKIHVSATWANNKNYTVSGSYPKNAKGQYVTPWVLLGEKTRSDGSKYDSWGEPTRPEITFNPNKGVEKIVKDIKTRFMPNYIYYRDLVVEKINKDNEYYHGIDKSALRVCEVLGIEPPKELGEGRIYTYGAELKEGYSIRNLDIYSSGQSVKMEIELPIDEALALLKTFKAVQ